MSFINPCNLLANVYPSNSESMPITEHNLEALQQQQHAFNDQQQPNFGDNNHICEEPAKKQKVAATHSLGWDSPVSEKPSNETSTILGLNRAWSTESVSATANVLMAQMHDSNFAAKVTTVQQEQEQQQGMWRFPPHAASTAVNQTDSPHQNDLASTASSNEENSKWETIDAKPMTEELQATPVLQGVNGIIHFL